MGRFHDVEAMSDPRILDAALQLLRAPKDKRAAMLERVPIEARGAVTDQLESLRIAMEERAAIREFDGEMTRAEAERLTRLDYGVPE
jgi:hypothetical protein